VLEIIRCDIRGQRLCRQKRLAITREDIANLALGNGYEWNAVNAVLKWNEQMPAAAQHIGLKASLTLERDKAGLHRPTTAHELLHNPNAVVRNVAQKPRDKNEQQQDTDDNEQGYK